MQGKKMSDDLLKRIEAFLQQNVKTDKAKYNWEAVVDYIKRSGFITVGKAMEVIRTRNRQLVYNYFERNLRLAYENGQVTDFENDKPFIKVKLGDNVYYTLYELVEKVKTE
jgi:hypothetical protein